MYCQSPQPAVNARDRTAAKARAYEEVEYGTEIPNTYASGDAFSYTSDFIYLAR